jgi:hypothetical protein
VIFFPTVRKSAENVTVEISTVKCYRESYGSLHGEVYKISIFAHTETLRLKPQKLQKLYRNSAETFEQHIT